MPSSKRRTAIRCIAVLSCAAALATAPACNDSLVDHAAGAAVLHPSTCDPGEVLCGDTCVAEDASHCGASCSSCGPAVPADPNAVALCTEAHSCAFECSAGWLRVGSACERAVTVSAGFAHSCAITTSGRVKCWGANEHGQLGDGTASDSTIPVDASLPGPASALAAGYVHTCAIVGGTPFCWGDNSTGALGDGTTTQRAAPVRVLGLSGATAVTAGGGEDTGPVPTFYGHSCATVAGSIACWGSNESGQLGDGTFVQRATPVHVGLAALDGRATAVVNGDRHTCAVVADAVWCWGAAGSWQLGNGATANQSLPVAAQGLASGTRAIAAGAAHSCAVVGASAPVLECWGSNSAGQAAGGDNSVLTVQRPAATTIAGLTPSGVAAGNAHTCVVGEPAGAVTCFGANDASQLGAPATARGSVRVQLPRAASAIAAGYDHTCALLDDGSVECWGANARGQLGVGTAGAPVPTPAPVSGR